LGAEIPMERGLLKRERSAGAYSGYAAYIARFMASVPLDLFFTLTLNICVYYMVGFQRSTLKILNYTVLSTSLVIAATAIGLVIGSVSKTTEEAQITGPIFAGIFSLFGGKIVNLDSAPRFLKW
jgi:ABC-type multidrug transport system permease subunit